MDSSASLQILPSHRFHPKHNVGARRAEFYRMLEDESSVLVADFGTAHTRLGLAHGDPRSFPSIARRASDRAGWQPIGPSEMMPQRGAVLSTAPSVALGEDEDGQHAQQGGGSVLVPALQRGVVTDWDAAEAVWRSAFEAVVGAEALAAHPVLVSEPPLNPVANRERLLATLFGFGVPAVHVSTAGVLAAYGAGRATATVLTLTLTLALTLPRPLPGVAARAVEDPNPNPDTLTLTPTRGCSSCNGRSSARPSRCSPSRHVTSK